MILTNAQMYDSLQVLAHAEERGVLGFAIARNRRKLGEELREFMAKRDELLAEHGTEDGPGTYKLTPEAAQAFSTAIRPYAEMTADVAVYQITAEEFCRGGLTSSQMLILDWMVKEGD